MFLPPLLSILLYKSAARLAFQFFAPSLNQADKTINKTRNERHIHSPLNKLTSVQFTDTLYAGKLNGG